MTRIRKSHKRAAVIIAFVILAMVALLLGMGRPPICTCGTVKLWEGAVNSAGNSQHLSDWYSFSHIIHGFIFYALTWLVLRQWLRPEMRLSLAVMIEAGWEILENSPIIIDRYRTATMALGYTGDSVLNSVSDVGMMMLGFWFASRAPAKVTVLVAIVFELFTLVMIRDNLTLNILMLTWPVDAIKHWQAPM